jgi:hypothetical protein
VNASTSILLRSYGQASPIPPPSHEFLRFELVIAPAGWAETIGPSRTANGLSMEDWYRTRHAAAVDALRARGLSLEDAWWVAMALVAHWAHETGHGRGESDYALGNIRATPSWAGPVHYLQGSDDLDGPRPYRAYRSLAAGVDDSVRLATGIEADGTFAGSSRYRPALVKLLASKANGPYVVSADGRTGTFPLDVVEWYADLTRAGWHPYSEDSQYIFRSTVTRALNYIGGPPAVTSPFVKGFALGTFALATGALAWFYQRPR